MFLMFLFIYKYHLKYLKIKNTIWTNSVMSGGCLHNGYFNTLNSKKNIIALDNLETNTRNLNVSESGSIITIDPQTVGNDITINLPSTNQVGCTYFFYFLNNSGDAAVDINISTQDNAIHMVGNFKFAVIADITGAAANAAFNAALTHTPDVAKITISDQLRTTKNGTLKITSITSTLWLVDGLFYVAAPHGQNLRGETGTDTLIVASTTI